MSTVHRIAAHRFGKASTAWALALLLPVFSHAAPAESSAGLDHFVDAVMAAGSVPGLALVIVKDDRVIVARGYGTRDLETKQPVDADTMFGLASATKAFTSTAIAMLVDRGQVRFDDPLSTLLLGFRVADPYVSEHATLRDALGHRTATSSSDLLWYLNGSASRRELLRHFDRLPQDSSLRERFIYSNLMYMLAGSVVAELTGSSWEDFVTEEILQPLGMDRSSPRLASTQALPNVASPHVRIHDEITRVPHSRYQAIGPSGAMYTSAQDMATWMRFLLNEGEFDGTRLVSRNVIRETMTPQMIVGRTGPADEIIFPGANFIAYGMGWFISDYRGQKTLSHTGGIDGMASFVALMPSERLGVAVLENLEHDLARFAIRNRVFDRYLGHSGDDWLARYVSWIESARQPASEVRPPQAGSAQPVDRAAFSGEQYSVKYVSELFGLADVHLKDDAFLYLRLGDLAELRLIHREGNTFELSWPDVALNSAGPSSVTFHPAADGHPLRFVLSGPILDGDVVYIAFGE